MKLPRARTMSALVATAVIGSVAGAGTAHAASAAGNTAAQVRAILAANPHSRQVGADTVELQPGVTMSVRPNVPDTCGYGDLCLYKDANFNEPNPDEAYEVDFYYCGIYNLANYSMPNGVRFNNQVSSIDNAQYGNVQSRFYNNGNFMLALNSGHYLRNLADDSSADGGNANDKIDTVFVC